ncbi:MAG: flagellar motor switch phosphatase FliY [Bacillota bacterium]
MADNKMLSQEEIDALLKASSGDSDSVEDPAQEFAAAQEEGFAAPETDSGAVLDQGEMDALGEIGNISMGSAATTLSELLRQKVNITSPKVKLVTQTELFEAFQVPYIIIQVEFKAGLDGFNILVIRLKDAMIMSNLMMGGDGVVETEEISEIEISAASEAMNQMIGTASTSLATLFGRPVNISPPISTVWSSDEKANFRLPIGDTVVVVSFEMKIGDLLDTEIMQVLSINTAKREAALLWNNLMGLPLPEGEETQPPGLMETHAPDKDEPWLSEEIWQEDSAGNNKPLQDIEPTSDTKWSAPGSGQSLSMDTGSPISHSAPAQVSNVAFPALSQFEQKKLELLLDVPLRVSVVLGRTKRPIKEVLNLTPGAIVELNSLVDEPVEVLVNGTLVARGEVVVVNENFGVRITNIISPEERLKQLKE